MKHVLLLVVLYVVIVAIVLGSGTGLGLLLCWLLPSVGPGQGILIGVISLSFSLHWLIQLMGLANDVVQPEEGDPLPLIRVIPMDPPRTPPRRGRRK
ncbi:MAG: hypothetical protein NVSMB9_27320 [Isosphaeraceae bacterium]